MRRHLFILDILVASLYALLFYIFLSVYFNYGDSFRIDFGPQILCLTMMAIYYDIKRYKKYGHL